MMKQRIIKPPKKQVMAGVALFGIICAAGAITGCGESKPPATTAPGSEHVAAEKQDERDTSVVHTPNDGASGSQTTGSQTTGNQSSGTQ